MKYRYSIVDLKEYSIVRCFDDETEARSALYELRKHRYIDEHPGRPIWEYDTIKHDNNYNLMKYTVIA